ncbi:intracellular protein transport protein USO1-like [Nicotiana tomentosiformis]|uniref:intracellular protein transport protein USO1-like n=1 Tax=Nicotiana tomentosiformis TaxID=4098 RepID=UPI00388CE84D
MLTTEYKLFRMKDDESIQDMRTHFTSIINELHSLGETIPRNNIVRKILSVLPSSWESKVNAIAEAKELQTLTIDKLVGNLKTYEMKKKKDNERREPKREKNLVLKTDSNDSSGEDGDMAYLTRRFQKMVRRNTGIPKRENSSKSKIYDLCNKCGKPGHFIKECPLLKQDHYKNNFNKASKRNPVPDKHFKRKNATSNVVKQALAAWGDSSSESEEENDHGDSSMMAVESEATEYDSIFALMAQFDDDEDDDDDEVNFLDIQRNLKSYSPKKLMSLANVLINAYHSLINDKDALTVELGEAEQTRVDLVIVIVDLKETIENLKKEKDALDENIANIEHERDDLMVIVVDLKETFEYVRKEKEALAERVANIEHERDDILVVVVDLKETIGKPKIESRPKNSQKGKKVSSEAHIKLESELNSVKSSLCVELEKNKQLHEELGREKSDLEKSLKWTWSSDAITAMYTNNGGNRQGIGFQREKIPYNPHRKYVTVPDNYLCTHCGNTGHFKENYKARFQSQQKNKVFAKKETVKGNNLQWYMDSGYSKHMTRSTNDFLSLKVVQGGSVSFGNGKKGYILGVGRIGKSLSHSIKNLYYVNGLKYSLLSVSQICDKNGDLNCLSAIDDDAELWHRRLGHASFMLLKKLYRKDLVRGLPKSCFKDHKVCDACVKDKQVRSSFKPKKEVSTSKSLDLLHMDLCGLMRVESRGGKKYIFVIVDDYSRFTWTLFLITKDETFEVFFAFVKRIQVKMGNNVACIRSDHRTEFNNAKFDEFCTENSITHNFSAPRIP